MKEWLVVIGSWIIAVFNIVAVVYAWGKVSNIDTLTLFLKIEYILIVSLSLLCLLGIYKKNVLTYRGTLAFLAYGVFMEVKSFGMWVVVGCSLGVLPCPKSVGAISILVGYIMLSYLVIKAYFLFGFIKYSRIHNWYKLTPI